MSKPDMKPVEENAANKKRIPDIDDVAAFKSCLTCVYRKPYPASMRSGCPVFQRFYCSLAVDSLKPVVTRMRSAPAGPAPPWKKISLDPSLRKRERSG